MIIKKISSELIAPLAKAFKGWPKPLALFEAYYNEQKQGNREIWID